MANARLSLRRGRWFYVTAAVLIIGAVIAGTLLAGAQPTNVIVMTTGTRSGPYEAVALRYKTILARSGVELRLLSSAGSVENLKRLQDPNSGVQAGFADGGLIDVEHASDLLSLGTMFYEPLWFFYRDGNAGHAKSQRFQLKLAELHGRKIAIGPEGSATKVLTERLLALNGVDSTVAELLPLTPADAAQALLAGQINAAFMVASWDTFAVRNLMASSDIEVLGFDRADAYVALFPYLTKLTLPMGVGNMATNRPSEDVSLMALKASLVVRSDLDPALQYLLLDAASQVHSVPGIFNKAGEFPAPEQIDVPLSPDAQQFYKSGRPFLQRYLPFRMAVWVGRSLLVLIPVVGIIYPLLRLLPVVYGWSMRRRIFRLYGELKFIELEVEGNRGDPAELRKRLDSLEERANHLRVPLAFAQFSYTLRGHIDLARARLQSLGRERTA